MKKQILIASLLLGSVFCAGAQTLISEDFSAFNVGNVGTSTTGNTPGQGNYYTYVGTPSDYQIINDDGTHGKVLKITSTSGDTEPRYMWKGGLPTVWSTRTAGNNIIEVEYEFYTGWLGSGNILSGVILYDATYTKQLAGLTFSMYYKSLRGVAYSTSGGVTDNFTYNLGNGENLTLFLNTWVKVGFSFNQTTGQVRFKVPSAGVNKTVPYPAGAGVAPFELDYQSDPLAGNTVADIIKFDNFVCRASNTDTLLGVDATVRDNSFSVFPNPAENTIAINSQDNIIVKEIFIADLNGRIVKNKRFNPADNIEVNIADLASGIYMITISSDQGSITKKIVKK